MDLGSQNDLMALAILCQRFPDNEFAGVDVGGIEEVNSGIQCPVDDPDCFVLRGGKAEVVCAEANG